jgi:hypothetical protein
LLAITGKYWRKPKTKSCLIRITWTPDIVLVNGANMEINQCPHPISPDATVIAYSIDTVPVVAGITRTQVFDAIRTKKLTARKCGRRTIIEVGELRRWISTLPTRGRQPTNDKAAPEPSPSVAVEFP